MSDDAYQDGSGDENSLPVPVSDNSTAQSLAAYEAPASFTSQLMADIRTRKRPNPPTRIALGAYGTSAKSTVKRMPAGHRHTSEI